MLNKNIINKNSQIHFATFIKSITWYRSDEKFGIAAVKLSNWVGIADTDMLSFRVVSRKNTSNEEMPIALPSTLLIFNSNKQICKWLLLLNFILTFDLSGMMINASYSYFHSLDLYNSLKYATNRDTVYLITFMQEIKTTDWPCYNAKNNKSWKS